MNKFGVRICVPTCFTEDDAIDVLYKTFRRLANAGLIASKPNIKPVGLERSFDIDFEMVGMHRIHIRMNCTITFTSIGGCNYRNMINEISEELYRQLSSTIVGNSVYGLTPRERGYCLQDIDAVKHVLNGRFGVPVKPKKVIFNNPATIVFWSDGTKTVVKRQKGDRYNKETGLAMCYVKKFCGNNTSRGLNDILKLANEKEEK